MKCEKSNCNAHAIKGSKYCFTHDPNSKEKHIEAAKKGGLAVRDIGNVKLESLSLTRPEDTVALLEDTINRVRVTRDDGTMDLKTANCIGYLVGQLLKAIEVTDIASRLEIVERIIIERKSLIK